MDKKEAKKTKKEKKEWKKPELKKFRYAACGINIRGG